VCTPTWRGFAHEKEDKMMDEDLVTLQSVILHVADLDRAIAFYCHLLDLRVTRHAPEAAVLAEANGIDVVALRQRHVDHFTDRTVQALVWNVPSLPRLSDIEQKLHHLDAAVTQREVTDEGRTVLSAVDRDGQRLLFIHREASHIGASAVPREVFWY
jgi:catechol 2,3-dioxygenase-like lactoylglutathione lyase family enzyme